MLQALEILNPEKMPEAQDELKGYGQDSIKAIIKHYGAKKPGGFEPVIDAEALPGQWKLFKHTLHQYRLTQTKASDAFEDLLPPKAAHGKLPSEIEKLICIRLIMMLNTACCERGFSRMGLVKTYLRNSMYVETLDALMMIGLVGKDFVDLSNHQDPTLKEALERWEKECLRNPNQARFGNKSAAKKKKRVRESRTVVPTFCPEGAAPEGGDGESEDAGLDTLADEAEKVEEESSSEDEGEAHHQPNVPFKLPGYEVEATRPTEVSEKELSGVKIAYCFDDGWDVGVFKKKYKGKSVAFRGTFQVYFQSFKKNYFPKLELDQYGPTSTWCIVKLWNQEKRK